MIHAANFPATHPQLAEESATDQFFFTPNYPPQHKEATQHTSQNVVAGQNTN